MKTIPQAAWIVLGVLVLGALLLWVSVRPPASQEMIAEKDTNSASQFQATNPDYVNNPSAYVVDYEDKVSSDVPLGRALWVEEVADHHSLKVSYAVNRVGMQILDFTTIHIPGLSEQPGAPSGFPPSGWNTTEAGRCWTSGAVIFLNSNLLHRVVYLTQIDPLADDPAPLARLLDSEGYMLQIEDGSDETMDAAAFLIGSGHGAVALGSEPNYSYPAVLKDELKRIQEVADLAGSGLWKTCPRVSS